MGRALAEREVTLVFGGGGTGMMGAVADAVLEGGGHVIGVIPQNFNTPQLLHANVSELHVVASMHARKQLMAELADAFVALPGGFGTFEELFEILTWAQIGLHSKPVGVLNTNGYFDSMHRLIEEARHEGFIYSEHRDLLLSASAPDDLLEMLYNYRAPEGLERWVNRREDRG
jgi:uncharacterized protein (TIGR00730 family)